MEGEKKKKKAATETEDALVKAIEDAAIKAFAPDEINLPKPELRYRDYSGEFDNLILHTHMYKAIKALNVLIKPGRVSAAVRPHLMRTLTRLPQEAGGVRSSIEFVFSVHPSSTVKSSEAANPQQRGANITMENLKMASNLISSPPEGVNPGVWFRKIAPQLFILLDGEEGPDLVKVAAYIIGFGILGRRKFGVRGAPGWDFLALPILEMINPSMNAHLQPNSREPTRRHPSYEGSTDIFLDMVKRAVLVTSDELATALKRLSSLLNSHPNPSLTGRLLHPIIPHLWALSSWPNPDEDTANRYNRPANLLLRIMLKLSNNVEDLRQLIDNLLFRGQSDKSMLEWKYERSVEGGIRVRYLQAGHIAEQRELDMEEIEFKVNTFVQLLQSLKSDTEISALFLILLHDSLAEREEPHHVKIRFHVEQPEDPTSALIKAKVLQKMMKVMPNKLVSDPKNILNLVKDILGGFQLTPGGDDLIAIALSLLNLVVAAPEFKKSEIDKDVLAPIEISLDMISRAQDSDVSQTARNISLLLTYRDAMDDPSEQPSAPTDQQVENRKTYNLAMQYITDPDSLPPVRSEGLNLLSTLIEANSPILDIPTVLALLSSLLTDDEDYINLRVIKLFTQLAKRHPNSVTKEILEHYVDTNEQANTDTRLRFGEALTQVIQRLGETFTGEAATLIGENLLATAGRRGYRPQTEKRQEREARAKARKHKEASDAWSGEVPDLGDDDERTEEERARDEAIAQIVGGWESKRGSEDLRIRASALSTFAVGLETNMAGLGATLVEASVDLCLNILTLEPEPEAGILRRSAIIVVFHFVRGLAEARDQGRKLGFGLQEPSRGDIARILRYVAQTDNDGLVQSNAKEVVESLDNWTLSTLVMPEARGAADDGGPAAMLTRLAGLNISAPSLPPLQPVGSGEGCGARGRPRIEEVE